MPGLARRRRTSTAPGTAATSGSGRAATGRGNAARAAGLSGQGAASEGGLDMFGQAVASQGAGAEAWAAVVSGQRMLRRGDEGPAVRQLQTLLVGQGQQLGVDGDFGPRTDRAVRAFQSARGLGVDGIVGPGTAGALGGGRAAAPAPRRQQPTPGQQPATRTEGRVAGGAQRRDRQVAGVDISPAQFERQGLRAGVFAKALDAFRLAFAEGQSDSFIVTVIDYELPSSERRLWVIDLERKKLLFHEFTSHGSGSDRNHDGRMDQAGNVNGSGRSNVGLLKTAETYTGKHGKSLRLDGLERGFNDNARQRAVVFHAADYVDDRYIARNGKAGRSLGCPALDPDVSGRLIDTIKGGKLVFAYYPDPQWLRRSRYLNGGNA